MKIDMKKFKEGCGEVIAEILLSLLFFGIGVVVLSLLGVDTDAEWLDGDLMMLIGLCAVIIPVGIIFAALHILRKRKKRNIKKIKIYSKNELENTERNGQDDV